MADKFIIYQLLPRVFGNTNEHCVSNGSLSLNTSGKFIDITSGVLEKLKELHVTHVWYTGVIEHATKADFTQYGIAKDNPAVIKGEAGSPYAIKDYYDVNPYLAQDVPNRMGEFEALLQRTHKAGLKVIIDFVPNHVARCYQSDSLPGGTADFGAFDQPYATVPGGSNGFHPDNNFYYLPNHNLDISHITTTETFPEHPAKVTGNDCFSASPSVNDWYETVKLNYGVDYQHGGIKNFHPIPRTWQMMLDILRFWSAKGVDGFRCDMAEMVPVEFWHWAIGELKKDFPATLFIAEVYNPALYDSYLHYGRFDYLYDKVGLYDHLKAVTQSHAGVGNGSHTITGEWHPYKTASSITSNWQALGEMQNSMLNFLENHDEQRVASNFNIGDPYKAIPELVVSLMLNRAPFMLYFGQEFGEPGMLQEGFSGIDGRTSIFDFCSSPSVVRFLKSTLLPHEQEIYSIYKKLFSIAMEEAAIKNGDTYDLEYANLNNPSFHPDTQFAFARRSRKNIHNLAAPDELIFIIADFSQSASTAQVALNLPKHLFDFWNIQQKKAYNCTNLLTHTSHTITLSADTPLPIQLTPQGIALLRISNR